MAQGQLMGELVVGLVTDVDVREVTTKDGRHQRYIDVWVCVGRDCRRTTGTDDGYTAGEHVCMIGHCSKSRFSDAVEFVRKGRLPMPQFPREAEAK